MGTLIFNMHDNLSDQGDSLSLPLCLSRTCTLAILLFLEQ